MYRLQVWFDRHWKWGINTYPSIESARHRMKELRKVGIKSRVVESKQLFN